VTHKSTPNSDSGDEITSIYQGLVTGNASPSVTHSTNPAPSVIKSDGVSDLSVGEDDHGQALGDVSDSVTYSTNAAPSVIKSDGVSDLSVVEDDQGQALGDVSDSVTYSTNPPPSGIKSNRFCRIIRSDQRWVPENSSGSDPVWVQDGSLHWTQDGIHWTQDGSVYWTQDGTHWTPWTLNDLHLDVFGGRPVYYEDSAPPIIATRLAVGAVIEDIDQGQVQQLGSASVTHPINNVTPPVTIDPLDLDGAAGKI
jgi:hypothetical protein